MQLRFGAVIVLLATLVLSACDALFEPPWERPATFAPTPGAVEALLRRDRVRPALSVARRLNRQYPSFRTDLLLGRAMWRNGDPVQAASRFRRGSDEGLAHAHLGWARVGSSQGDWSRSVRLAGRALDQSLGDTYVEARAHALLAAGAWRDGRVDDARGHLLEWIQRERDGAMRDSIGALANAVARLEGTPDRWVGGVATIELERSGRILSLSAKLGSRRLRLGVDLTATHSFLDPDVADDVGLVVDGTPHGEVGARGRHPRQLHFPGAWIACPRLLVGGLEIHDLILGVHPLPPGTPAGVDGILGADLLLQRRWGLDPLRRRLALEASRGRREPGLLTPMPHRVGVWARGRPVREGLSAQWFLVPRIGGDLLAAAVDPLGASRLDLEDPAASRSPPTAGEEEGPEEVTGATGSPESARGITDLRLGEWRRVIGWEPADLSSWATGGGVAPRAVLGEEFFRGWTLHWDPELGQLGLARAENGDT